MSDYFFIVFAQENMQDLPNSDKIFRVEENEKLTDITITKEIVEQEIDKLKSSSYQDQMKYIPQYLRIGKRL